MYNNKFNTRMDIQHRQIKIQLEDKSFRNYFGINKNRLRRLLVKHQPINVYRSVSKWIGFSEHPTYPNILLESDLLIDIDDNQDIEYGKEINKHILKNFNNLELQHHLMTGGGQHLLYKHKILPQIHYKKRVDYYIKEKKKVVESLKKQGFNDIDYDVCLDLYRISRIDNTLNSKRNVFCHEIDSLERKSGSEPESTMTNRKLVTSSNPFNAMDGMENQANPAIHILKEKYTVGYISNSVSGAKKLAIPVIRWKKVRRKRLRKLINRYNLGSFMHISTSDYHYFVFFNCFSVRRLEKIYRFAFSNALRELQNFSWNLIPVFGHNFPIKMEYFDIKQNNNHLSKPHLDLFSIKKECDLVGKGKLKVFEGEYQRIKEE